MPWGWMGFDLHGLPWFALVILLWPWFGLVGLGNGWGLFWNWYAWFGLIGGLIGLDQPCFRLLWNCFD